MDRRSFIESCTAAAAGMSAASFPAWAGHAQPREYARVLLVDERGDPLRASALKPQTNYVFHYPYATTPALLLDLGRAASANVLSTRGRQGYAWPGGVGAQRSIVAYSAICPHDLAFPTRERSALSFRRKRAQRGVQDGLIHCCEDHSQYDPARGAEVLAGPAPQPLAAVLLVHDARNDQLNALATLGGEMFEEFFRKHGVTLAREGSADPRAPVQARATVIELEKYSRNPVKC